MSLLLPFRAAEASIALVQSQTANGDAGADASTSSVAWTTGNTIIIVLGDAYSISFYGYSHFCGDGGSNTYNQVALYSNGGNSPSGTVEIWAAYNVTGGTRPVVCSSITQPGYISIRVYEFSGLDASPFDQSAAGPTSGTTTFTTPTVTTTQASELLLGVVQYSAAGFTATGGAGWTDSGEVSGLGRTIESSYQTVSATGTYAYSGTGSAEPTLSAIATFKAAGVSACTSALASLGAGKC